MSVLYVNTPAYIGGSEISLLTLMEHLRGSRFSPVVVTGSEGAFPQRTRAASIPTLVQDFAWFSRRRPWLYGASIARLAYAARKHRAELLHTNCDRSLSYVQWASRLTGVPHVAHVRDVLRNWFDPPHLRALNHAARVVTNSRSVAESCIRAGVEERRVICIYNPVEVTRLREEAEIGGPGIRAALGIPPDALTIGIVGQIQPVKGHVEFVQAAFRLAAARDSGATIYFLVVGAPPPDESQARFAATLRADVERSVYAERFRFTGFREDVGAVLGALDIVAVHSSQEAFGRSAVEAMAAGCAVVASEVGGLKEIVTHESNGLLVPPRNPEALASALDRLVRDGVLRERLGEAARRSADRFSAAAHVQSIQRLYEAVLEERRPAPYWTRS